LPEASAEVRFICMSSAPANPALKLVHSGMAPGVARLPDRSFAGRIREENLAAVAAVDPRWVLAVRAAGLIEGGRAALLSQEGRHRLHTLASRLQLRPFDAALVIAIVQDAARAGEDPLGRQAQSRLSLVGAGANVREPSPAVLMLVSAVLAALFLATMAWWLAGR
jgi:hypothetical protein